MQAALSLLTRHVASVLAAKLLFRGLRVAKLRHLLTVGVGGYLLYRALSAAEGKMLHTGSHDPGFDPSTEDGPWSMTPEEWRSSRAG